MSVHKTTQKVFRYYSSATRSPKNLKSEINRVEEQKDRAKWLYHLPNLDTLKSELEKTTEAEEETKSNVYYKFAPLISRLSLDTARIHIDILDRLKNNLKIDSIKVRESLYRLNFSFGNVERDFYSVMNDNTIPRRGNDFFLPSISSENAREKAYEIIENAKNKFNSFISNNGLIGQNILDSINVRIELKDDPSFLMKCIDASGNMKIMLNESIHYNPNFLKFGILHEFCGHALERGFFDFGLVKNGEIPDIFSYNDISSQTVFDVKSEVFADRMANWFLDESERKYYNFRKNVWLLTRAMGDLTYNLHEKTINDVIDVFNRAGMNSLAFEEALMASLFIDGFQSQYYFADKEMDLLRKDLKLDEVGFLSLLLVSGKVPISNLHNFYDEIRKV